MCKLQLLQANFYSYLTKLSVFRYICIGYRNLIKHIRNKRRRASDKSFSFYPSPFTFWAETPINTRDSRGEGLSSTLHHPSPPSLLSKHSPSIMTTLPKSDNLGSLPYRGQNFAYQRAIFCPSQTKIRI